MLYPKAETFHRRWPSYSRPVLVTCDDGKKYVLKGAHCGKAIVNEQIVARLGFLLGAPVCPTLLIEIPEELCNIEPQMNDISPGLAHAINFIDDCSERAGIDHTGVAENRERFAHLEILYTWMHAGDHQLIYRTTPPHLVYSVDHGHFFPGGPDWSVQTLASAAAILQYDQVFTVAAITRAERSNVLAKLTAITDTQIDEIVAGPPASWGIDLIERAALSAMIKSRKSQILALPNTL